MSLCQRRWKLISQEDLSNGPERAPYAHKKTYWCRCCGVIKEKTIYISQRADTYIKYTKPKRKSDY